jgi:hypothetical protein
MCDFSRIWLFCLFDFLAPKDFKDYLAFQSFDLSVPDVGYSRKPRADEI